MYALHDAGQGYEALPSMQPTTGPPGQIERRAIEPTERGQLATDEQDQLAYSSTAAVLELLHGSAERFREVAEALQDPDAEAAAGDVVGSAFGTGNNVDLYA